MGIERKSIGKDAAISLYEEKWWEGCTARQICAVQLSIDEICIPFSLFHAALEESLCRSVWTHELALNWDGIVSEFLGEQHPPTMKEFINLIPEEKRLIVVTD